ncbi:hypothetical protein ACQCVP_18920 [Rossellomorea vietnamensis]|uniref:hypothetical protein n=1 Tax=Rossellomorea vietnamensis TaxID=218284 RepID=UPI003CEBB2B6
MSLWWRNPAAHLIETVLLISASGAKLFETAGKHLSVVSLRPGRQIFKAKITPQGWTLQNENNNAH